MATNGSIDIDDSVHFELSECDVQHGGCVPALEEKLYSPVGLPCILFDEAAAASDEHGTLTCVQPDGSMPDGLVNSGLEKYVEVAATLEPAIGSNDEKDPFDDLPFASVQVALPGVAEHLDVATTSAPAIGKDKDEDPFDDLPFTAVREALWSMCPCAYGVGDIVKIGHTRTANGLQDAMAIVVGIGEQRECTNDIEVQVSIRGSKFWILARHLEMVTKKPIASSSNPRLCLVSTLDDNRVFLKRYASCLKK